METTTPDTLNYYISGYIIFTVVMTGYIASLFYRWKSLKREQQSLEELEKK